jgi:DNA-binding transcriptional LysR family regulator
MTGSALPDESSATRVVIGGLPELLLRMVVELLQQQPDMLITAVVHDPVELLVAAKEGPDVAVIGGTQRDSLPGIATHLLTQFPAMRVLVLTTQNDDVFAFWMGLHRKRFEVRSGKQLTGIVRWLGQMDALVEHE